MTPQKRRFVGERVRLEDVAQINPKAARQLNDEDEVIFLPLASVNVDGTVSEGIVSKRGEVKKGHPYFRQGDVLVAKITPSFENGKIALASIPLAEGYSSTEFHVVRANPERVRPDYLLAFLRSPQVINHCSQRMKGSAGQKRVPKEVLSNLQMDIPSLDAQADFCLRLNSISGLIRACQLAIDRLDSLVKSRFVEMFGSGDECGGFMCKLSDVAEIASGITKGRKIKKAELIAVPYLSTANVQTGRLDLSVIKTIDATPSEIERFKLFEGDVLMTEGGDPDKVGRGAIAHNLPQNCIHQNHVFRVRLNTEVISPEYFESFLQSPDCREYFFRSSKQTTGIATINRTQLNNLPVWVPPTVEQHKFTAFAAQVDKSRFVDLRNTARAVNRYWVLGDAKDLNGGLIELKCCLFCLHSPTRFHDMSSGRL